MSDIQKYAEEIHKPVKRKFDRRTITATAPNNIWSVDLLDVSKWKEQNNGVTFLLIIIDIYSRYLYVVPLKNKTQTEVLNAFMSLDVTPNNLWTDEGSEFYNNKFAKFCEEKHINHYHTYSGLKSVFAERFNRTLRETIARYFTENNTFNYLIQLDRFVDEYNNKKHSSIKQKPIDVYRNGAIPYSKISFFNSEPKYKKGDFVRVSKIKKTFEKGYTPRWSKEVFKIIAIDTSQYPLMYELADQQGELVTGKFYEDELQKTDLQNFALIEEVIERKTINRRKMALVKYQGYGSKFNEWIPESQIINLLK